MKFTVLLSLLILCISGCSRANDKGETQERETTTYMGKTELATFAGGCFWCIEAPFEGIDGVISVLSGYLGGKGKNPTYLQVVMGKTGHKEAVQITFDPDVISYEELVDIFWQQFDPTDEEGSFYDKGTQYQSAIFYHDNRQKKIAEDSKKRLEQSGKFSKPIVTSIVKYSTFYMAEDYHQDYYKKNPEDYNAYKTGSGREKFIESNWPVPDKTGYRRPSGEELKNRLTPLQYQVTMEGETETAFNNEFNDNTRSGIYVCIVSGAPLFSSKDKFDSKTGWPSFTKPIDARFLEKLIDKSHGMTRVEVRSKYGDAHGGHVFNDGPAPNNLRYCMNSAAFRFVPKEDMEKEGYGDFVWMVD